MHKFENFFKNLYSLGRTLPKNDKLGIYNRLELTALNVYELLISAAFAPKQSKSVLLQNIRIKVEITKRIIRLMSDLKIINNRQYYNLQNDLQEISKMANGWQKYLSIKKP
ncbi:MAG: four helix bundle protein [bacterium]